MSFAMRPIAPIDVRSLAGITPATTERVPEPTDLGGTFKDALAEAHATEQTSTQQATAFAHGDTGVGIHEVMIASEKANISLRFATTMKNKVLEAYRELMNTQV